MVRSFEASPTGLVAVEATDDLARASGHLPAGAYTTLRTYRGRRFLRLDRHVDRLVTSAGGAAPLERARVGEALDAALRATGFSESRLRLTWAPPRLFVSVEPFTPLPEPLYRGGVACATVHLHRTNPHAKDTRFIAPAEHARAALPPDVHEGLLVDERGALLEGLTSNFFAVLDGALRTEEGRVLPGVTRSLVLELASGLLPVDLHPVGLGDLGRISECFLTSASRGILPVVRIGAQPIGDGKPGPVTRELMRRLEARIETEAARVHC